MESAPESLAFWKAAASDARSGRRSDAAAALDYGAELWGASALVPALRAMAAIKHAASDPARVLAALGVSGGGALSDAARALGPEAVARLAERAGDRPALETALGLAAEQAVDTGSDPGWRSGAPRSFPPRRARRTPPRWTARAKPLPGTRWPLALSLAEPGVEPAAAASTLGRLATTPSELPRSAERRRSPRRARWRWRRIARARSDRRSRS